MSPSAAFWALPGVLQAGAMLADELVYHRRRGLPFWERVGHPVDTGSVVACLAWLLAHEPGPAALQGYVVLATLSTLIVTKDEWIHARECSAAEHWLHSVLFVLHPVALGVAGRLWWQSGEEPDPFRWIVGGQAALAALFGVYQLVYWNVLSPGRGRMAR